MNFSGAGSDDAFLRERQKMVIYPVITLVFAAVFFGTFGGGEGRRHQLDVAVANQPGVGSFNAKLPNAKDRQIASRTVESPGYGKAPAGQVLSDFSRTRDDSVQHGMRTIPVSASTGPVHTPAAYETATAAGPASSLRTGTGNQVTAAAPVVTSQPVRKPRNSRTVGGGYYYQPAGSAAYSDQQVESQLQNYQPVRSAPVGTVTSPAGRMASQPATDRTADVRLNDAAQVSSLGEPAEERGNPFNTAPVAGSGSGSGHMMVSSGNSKRSVSWMIPVVVHEDQTVRAGQQVKLRLTREISADGITIPASTILYAICQPAEDRLKLTVRSVQINGQLIPLDLEVYDMDGSLGVNMPGLSNQASGQLQSSALSGLNVPVASGLVNGVLNSARMQASSRVRQPTMRLRGGYNLYLKA